MQKSIVWKPPNHSILFVTQNLLNVGVRAFVRGSDFSSSCCSLQLLSIHVPPEFIVGKTCFKLTFALIIYYFMTINNRPRKRKLCSTKRNASGIFFIIIYVDCRLALLLQFFVLMQSVHLYNIRTCRYRGWNVEYYN